MCCDPKQMNGVGDAAASVSCCRPHGFFFRRFITSKERRERLEEYKSQLEEELTGVDERIRELKGD